MEQALLTAGGATPTRSARHVSKQWLILGGLVAAFVLMLAGTSSASAQVRIVTIQQVSSGLYADTRSGTVDTVMVVGDGPREGTQEWRLTPLGNNIYTIQQVSSGLYVDAFDYAVDPNTIGGGHWMVMRTEQNNGTQQWRFTEIAPNVFTIQQVSTGRYAVGLPDPDYGYPMYTSEDAAVANAQWRVTTLNLVANPNAVQQIGPAGIQVAPPVTPQPIVHSQGSRSILAASTLDLDNGAANGPGADIRYQLLNHLIVPLNGARLRISDIAGGYGINQCINMTYGNDPVSIDNLQPGWSVCYLTSEGRIGQLVIDNVGVSLNVTYTTWEP